MRNIGLHGYSERRANYERVNRYLYKIGILTNLFEQDRLKASYGKSLEGKSMPKGSFQRPRLVRKGSKEAAEDGPGAAQVKAETVLACAGSAR